MLDKNFFSQLSQTLNEVPVVAALAGGLIVGLALYLPYSDRFGCGVGGARGHGLALRLPLHRNPR